MGADMMIATLTIPLKDLEGPEMGKTFKNYEPKIEAFIKTMTTEELMVCWDNAGREYDDETALKDTLAMATEGLTKIQIETIDVLKGLQPDGAREFSYITHKGDRIYVTGGMSWGDDPTDSFWQTILISEIIFRYRGENDTNVAF